MPINVRLTNRYSDRGSAVLVIVEFAAGIPLDKARIVNAWIAGTLRRHELAGDRIQVAIDDAMADVSGHGYVARVVGQTSDEVVIEVAKG